MFIPIGDSPNLPKIPWLTWGLIAINVAIHIALWPLTVEPVGGDEPALAGYVDALRSEVGELPPDMKISRADLVRFEYGVKPGSFTLGDAMTSMFLHGGWLHLLGNMLFLWIFGDNVEHRLGRAAFLLAYVATGLLAAFGDLLLRWGSEIPSVGASGAISGVLGLYFAWFPANRVRVFVFLFPFLVNVIELSARFVLGVYLVLNNLLPLLLSGGSGGISYGAHIGGFLGGWALAHFLGGQRPTRSWEAPRWRPPRPEADLGGRFREALAGGRVEEAASMLFDLPRAMTRRDLNAADKVRLGEALAASGQARPALAAYQRALADHPRGPGRAAAHLGAARLLLAAFSSATSAYQHVHGALEEATDPAEIAEARALLEQIERSVRVMPRRRF